MSTEKILLEGWLEKKSPKKVTKDNDLFNNLPSLWQKRYFTFVRVGKHKAELRYYGAMTVSGWNTNVVADRKGHIAINSKKGRCSVSRKGSTNCRFTIITPRVSGSHHGIATTNNLAGTTLHEYSLRASNVSDARQWFRALHHFINGDDNAGMGSDTDDSDSGNEVKEEYIRPRRSARADAQVLRHRRLARRKGDVSPKPAPVSSFEYQPRPQPKAVRSAPPPRVVAPPSPAPAPPVLHPYRSGMNIPGIRSVAEMEQERGVSAHRINQQADRSKLQSKPPAGVRRASAMGKSIFQDAMLSAVADIGMADRNPDVNRKNSDRTHNRTVSNIHRELHGISGLDVVDAPVYDQVQHATQTRSQQPPPGIRTASMLDVTQSSLPGTSLPGTSSLKNATQHGSTGSTGSTGVPGRRQRKFSLIGDILNGTTTGSAALDSSNTSRSTYSPARVTDKKAVQTALNRSPSRRTNRSRTYSSTLESVGEVPPPPPALDRKFSLVGDILNGKNNGGGGGGGGRSHLLQAASNLLASGEINAKHYTQVRQAIECNDVAIVNAFKNYLRHKQGH